VSSRYHSDAKWFGKHNGIIHFCLNLIAVKAFISRRWRTILKSRSVLFVFFIPPKCQVLVSTLTVLYIQNKWGENPDIIWCRLSPYRFSLTDGSVRKKSPGTLIFVFDHETVPMYRTYVLCTRERRNILLIEMWPGNPRERLGTHKWCTRWYFCMLTCCTSNTNIDNP
jgi:hypothetical protein